jgi:AcrR family transcriptional regulator
LTTPPDHPDPPEVPEIAPAAEGRRERKKRELRKRIYDEAGRLFLRQGYDATTVEEIAEAADVAQATLFNYFPSKDDLIQQMTSEVFGVVRGLVEEQRKRRDASTAERIGEMASRATRLIQDTQRLTRDLLRALMRKPEGSGPLLADVRSALAEFMRDGQELGDVRSDRDAEFLAEMLIAIFYGTITHWLNDADYPFPTRMREAAEFLCESIAPRPVASKKEEAVR